MKNRAFLLVLAGICGVVAVLLALRGILRNDAGGSSGAVSAKVSGAREEGIGTAKTPGSSGNGPLRTGHERTKFGGPSPLNWTKKDLEEFLDERASTVKGRDLAILLLQVLPGPVGIPERPNQMSPESLTLKELAAVCERYLATKDCEMVYSSLWESYKERGTTMDFKREILDSLPIGSFRRTTLGEFYQLQIKSVGSVAEFLNSDEMKRLQIGVDSGNASSADEYAAAIAAVQVGCFEMLKNNKEKFEGIIETIDGSNMSKSDKRELKESVQAYLRELTKH